MELAIVQPSDPSLGRVPQNGAGGGLRVPEWKWVTLGVLTGVHSSVQGAREAVP